jgi:hypothetical protein
VLAVIDPKIEWTEAEGWPLYSGTLVGRQAIVDECSCGSGDWRQLLREYHSVDRRGRHRGGPRHLLLEPQGLRRARRSEDCHVWTLANGKVNRFQQHVDTTKERYLIA